jgi:hypothetical protein
MAKVLSVRPVGLRRCYDILNVSDASCYALDDGTVTHNCDEANFMTARDGDEGIAMDIYTNATRRLKSRFMNAKGEPAGMTILASSRKTKTAFLEDHVKNSRDDISAGRTRVYAFSQWEVHPPSKYTKPRFRVEVGNRIYPARILGDGEDGHPGVDVLTVPGEYRADFERDLEKSLRDIAGVATEGMMPLIQDKSVIQRCATAEHGHPFTREEITLDVLNDIGLENYFRPDLMFRTVQSKYVLRLNPNAARYIHVDIAFTNDSLGISMLHISGFKTVRRARPDGTWFDERCPVITVDFMLRIRPPPGSEIDIGKVRAFIVSLRDYGVPIWRISFDSYQSRVEVQILKKLGFDAVFYSVDKTDEAYLALRQAMVEERIVYYEYPTFAREISELERNVDKGTVDHPKKSPATGLPGGKDVSDTVAGAAWNALIDKRVLVHTPGVYNTVPSESIGARIAVTGGSHLWSDLEKELRS